MAHLFMALLWFTLFLVILAYRSQSPQRPVDGIDWWFFAPLILAGYNLVRWLIRVSLAKRTWSTDERDEVSQRPVVHPEFQIKDGDDPRPDANVKK